MLSFSALANEHSSKRPCVKLTLKVPPIIVFLLFCGAMFATAQLVPELSGAVPGTAVAAGVLLCLAIIVGLWPVVQFRLAKTTVHPSFPGRASTLVTEGIYRYTRNPMYLAMFFGLGAWGLWLQHPIALAIAALFPWYITRFQILPEEQSLRKVFGEGYARYCEIVPRWLL